MSPELSIIIPTYRRGQVLLDTIESLLGNSAAQAELIIVDQTERHEQAVIDRLSALEADGSIRWIRGNAPGITSSMNIGARLAAAPYLLFLDDDIIPRPALADAHLQAQRSEKGDVIAGRVLQPWHSDAHDSDPFTSTAGQFRQQFMGGNFSIRREVLIELGGFDENFKGAAYHYEREFADRLLKAGLRIWYEPTASIRHLHYRSGGTRSKGDHLSSWNPRHPVGAYYYFFVSPRVRRRAARATRRFLCSVLTRYHLRRPWYIPVTLVSEGLGLCWAGWLRLKGPALPFLKREPARHAP